MLSPANTKIWLYPTPIDFRKGMDSLSYIVADKLKMNPASGQLFIFRNKGLTKLKMLYWEDNGYWLFYKRLSKGKFILPIISDAAMGISRQQFSWLLSGLSLLEKTSHKPLKVQHIY